jgi:hypothetical protein
VAKPVLANCCQPAHPDTTLPNTLLFRTYVHHPQQLVLEPCNYQPPRPQVRLELQFSSAAKMTAQTLNSALEHPPCRSISLPRHYPLFSHRLHDGYVALTRRRFLARCNVILVHIQPPLHSQATAFGLGAQPSYYCAGVSPHIVKDHGPLVLRRLPSLLALPGDTRTYACRASRALRVTHPTTHEKTLSQTDPRRHGWCAATVSSSSGCRLAPFGWWTCKA